MVDLITDIDAAVVQRNLQRVHEEISRWRDPAEVQILAAVKYVPLDALGELADAGVSLVGENRAQELDAKAEAYPGRFTWDFIGHLQSRKVKQVLPLVRYVHSVASDSVLQQLGRHGTAETKVMVEVNVAAEAGKGGVAVSELEEFLERCPVTVIGLMTMPPLARTAEESRPHFVALRRLAEHHNLPELSMGTSQDYVIAVQEGATIVRLGTSLYARAR
jgi:uncharacterized pyridoxal phosphate-containing UPF0001 family protein